VSEKFSFDPLADFHNYREALRQMLEDGWVLPRDLMPSAMNAVIAPVDVLDNGPEIVVKASLPGVKPEEVSITILGGKLTIKAKPGEDTDVKGATYLRRERKTTAYVRTISLPVPVQAEQADARYKNGVLTLNLPKSENVRPRVIKVQSE